MQENNIEFVGCKSVKEEPAFYESIHIGEAPILGLTAMYQRKCGEIFTENNFDYMLICILCKDTYSNIVEFGKHFRKKHNTPTDEPLSISQNNPIHLSSNTSVSQLMTKTEEIEDSTTELPNNAEAINESEDSEEEENTAEADDENSFTCPVCKRSYTSKKYLKRHSCRPMKQNLHAKVPVELVESEEGDNATTEAATEKSLTCKVCKRIYASKKYLKHHRCRPKEDHYDELLRLRKQLQIIRPKRKSCKSADISCSSCGKFHSRLQECVNVDDNECDAKENSEQEGAEKTTEDDPNLFCDICERQFLTKMWFRNHVKQHSYPCKAFQSDPDYLKCHYCQVILSTFDEWRDHEKQHTDNHYRYSCTLCPKKFTGMTQYKEHMNMHTGERPYKCDLCSASFAYGATLSWHIKGVHLKLTPFTCKYCGKKFTKKFELTIHTRTHTGEKPFQCEECGQRFIIAKLLKYHMKRHTNTKDRKCPQCPKTFFSGQLLAEHLLTHSTERPFLCNACGKTFNRKTSLNIHKKLHTESKQYVCIVCGKAFSQPAGLYAHKKTHVMTGEEHE